MELKLKLGQDIKCVKSMNKVISNDKESFRFACFQIHEFLLRLDRKNNNRQYIKYL